MKTILSLCCALLMIAPVLFADEDAEGCKDSPMISRMAGSKINSCDSKEYDQATFPMGDAGDKVVEGEVHTWDYGRHAYSLYSYAAPAPGPGPGQGQRPGTGAEPEVR